MKPNTSGAKVPIPEQLQAVWTQFLGFAPDNQRILHVADSQPLLREVAFAQYLTTNPSDDELLRGTSGVRKNLRPLFLRALTSRPVSKANLLSLLESYDSDTRAHTARVILERYPEKEMLRVILRQDVEDELSERAVHLLMANPDSDICLCVLERNVKSSLVAAEWLLTQSPDDKVLARIAWMQPGLIDTVLRDHDDRVGNEALYAVMYRGNTRQKVAALPLFLSYNQSRERLITLFGSMPEGREAIWRKMSGLTFSQGEADELIACDPTFESRVRPLIRIETRTPTLTVDDVMHHLIHFDVAT